VLIAFTAVLLLVISVYQLDCIRLRHNLNTYREELKKQGVKFNINEVYPNSSPSSIEAGNELIKLCHFHQGGNVFQSFFVLTNNHKFRISQLPEIQPEIPWSVIEGDMQSNKVAIQKITQFIQNTNIAFPVPPLTIEALIDESNNGKYWDSLFSASRLFEKAEIYHLHQGNYNEAFANLMTLFRINKLIQNAPRLLTSSSQFSLSKSCLCTWELLEYNSWTDSQLLEIQNAIEEIDFFHELQVSLDMLTITEPFFFAEGRKECFINMKPSSPLSERIAEFFQNAVRSPERSFKKIVEIIHAQDWCARSFLKSEKHHLEYNFFWQQVTQKIKEKTPWSNLLQKSNIQYAQLKAQYGRPFWIEEPNSELLFKKMCLNETMRRIMITAIALKRFQLKNGQYPENLSELVPNYMSSIPIDPMSQKSLVYHLHPEDGYWLYSVGENGVDEMSKGLTPKTSQLNVTSFSLLKNGSDDLSWPRPASQEENEAEIKRITDLSKQYNTPRPNRRGSRRAPSP